MKLLFRVIKLIMNVEEYGEKNVKEIEFVLLNIAVKNFIQIIRHMLQKFM